LVANVKEKTMADMRTCQWCGRRFDNVTAGRRSHTGYCSEKCVIAARSAGQGSLRGASFSRGSSGSNIGGVILAIPIIGILIIIGLIGVAVNSIQNAFSDIKIDVVSVTCETQEKFVSILNEAGISGTVIEGEEFTTYSRQARDAVKEREGKYATFKDCVYFVRLPDSVNAYIWFKTEDQATAYVYKTE
jgi:hypothetical protein